VTHELNESEQTLRRLRDEIDRLTQEIKEANLQSLSIAPADDLKVLLEGTPTRSNSKALCSFVQLKRPLTTRPVPFCTSAEKTLDLIKVGYNAPMASNVLHARLVKMDRLRTIFCLRRTKNFVFYKQSQNILSRSLRYIVTIQSPATD
jgi:hypothetical protein